MYFHHPPTIADFLADRQRYLEGTISSNFSRGGGGNSPREVVDRLRDILRGTNLTIQRLRFTRRPRSRDREVQRNRFDCWHTFDSDEDSSSVFFRLFSQINRSEWNNFYCEYTSCTVCDNEARIRIFIVYLWFHTCGSVRMTINFLVGKVDTRRV